MGAVLSGDFGKLEALIARMRTLASPGFRAEVLQDLSDAAQTEIAAGFQRGGDPYGARWAPLRATRGRRAGGQPLNDTGTLRGGFAVRRTPTGFAVTNIAGYAGFHQGGTRRMPARMMVPARRDELGPYWRRSFAQAIERRLSRTMSR